MFTLTLMVTGQVQPVMLQFDRVATAGKATSIARGALSGVTPGPIVIVDDFAREFSCLGANLVFAFSQDVALGHQGDVAVQVLAHKAQSRLNKALRGDPEIQAEARMQQQGLLTPNGAGFRQ